MVNMASIEVVAIQNSILPYELIETRKEMKNKKKKNEKWEHTSLRDS